jgi:DNA topoisomerase-2
MILSRLRVRRLRPSLTVGCQGRSHVQPFLLEGAAGRAQLLPLGSQNRNASCALGASRLERRFFSSQAVEDDVPSPPTAIRENPMVETSVEDQYSRKTPLEHVLLRPGMYVGPNERLPPSPCWVLDEAPPLPSTELLMNPAAAEKTTTTLPPFRMVQKEYGVVPALIKIFDEILVNASDNRSRHPAGKSSACTRIDIIIDPGSVDRDPFIRICNDGKGIPIQIHKHENMYVPEMLFGHLLTGSNFDDNQKRLTGGRHGYGAKLTNIFSKSFTVETVDARTKLMYRQTWSNNMQEVGAPEITKLKPNANAGALKDYTAVSFVPDLPRLTGEHDPSNPMHYMIAPEEYAIMCRRVVDVAGCAAGKLRVTLNGCDVSMPSFLSYSETYRKANAPPLCFQAINARWMVGVGLSASGSFESMSFVNGMATDRGGTHVNVVVQQVTKRIVEKVEKSDAELGRLVSQGLVRRHLFVSVDALIENPSFDSQMKEYLTSSPTSFGSSYSLSEKFLNSLLKSEEDGGPGIVEEVLRVARGRQQASLFKEVGGKKTRRQLLSIPKLEDAHKAGSASGWDCTLVLTEGDSAKALAVAGFEVLGRERFGVFPLRGKFLNVREAAVSQLTKNAEVKALTAIMGLDFDKEYETVAERRDLRYGRIMLMTDQDTGTYIFVYKITLGDPWRILGIILTLLFISIHRRFTYQGLGHEFLSTFLAEATQATRRSAHRGSGRESTVPFILRYAALEGDEEGKERRSIVLLYGRIQRVARIDGY